MVQALSNEYQLGKTVVQKSFFLHSKRQLTKSFLVQIVDDDLSRDLLDGLTVLQSDSSLDDIFVLRKRGIKNSQIFSKVAWSSFEKLLNSKESTSKMATSLSSFFLQEYRFQNWKHNRRQCDLKIYVHLQFFVFLVF